MDLSASARVSSSPDTLLEVPALLLRLASVVPTVRVTSSIRCAASAASFRSAERPGEVLGRLVQRALALIQLLAQQPDPLLHLVDLLGAALQRPHRLVHQPHPALGLLDRRR